MKTLTTMAKVNRRIITDEDKSRIEKVIREIAEESHKTEDSLSPLDMMRHGNLSRTLNLFFAWTMACVSYYALSFSAADLSGHIILNFLLSRLISIPENGLVAWGINLIGRKKTLGKKCALKNRTSAVHVLYWLFFVFCNRLRY